MLPVKQDTRFSTTKKRAAKYYSWYLFQVLLTIAIAGHANASPYGVTVGITPFSHQVQSLYHSQDAYGQYVYGYATPTSAKNEVKTADGVTRGGYSYIDSNGILQTVQYSVDPIHGFRVAATNLPQDLPEVAYAKARHIAEYEATKAEHAAIAAERAVQYSNPVVASAAAVPQVQWAALPAPVQDLPEVARARAEHLAAFEATKTRDAAIRAEHAARFGAAPEVVHGVTVPVQAAAVAPAASYATAPAVATYTPVVAAPVSSQYHAQDEYGQYSYGYVGPLSSKAESKTADGITRGGYSYIDANGILQTVHYVSDPVNGFRVAASNLPVGPSGDVAGAVPPQAAAAGRSVIYNQEFHY